MTSPLRNPSSSSVTIPILLLKTRSHPHDAYEEYFSARSSNLTSSSSTTTPTSPQTQLQLLPEFIPVLEHKQNEETLQDLGSLLDHGRLKEKYGGMIFTSQRAVEVWADTVLKVERGDENRKSDLNKDSSSAEAQPEEPPSHPQSHTARDPRTSASIETDIQSTTPFPLYVVGPATSRALQALLSSHPPSTSKFQSLNASIHGAETGSGALLAPFIQQHYNALHAQKWFVYHDAPRLPFIPLLGMGSENYSRRRLETDDPRLRKKPLLFLVGEQRRDVIPKTLVDPRLGRESVDVEEVEVYSTIVRDRFREDLEVVLGRVDARMVVIVVFSPQGSGEMLKAVGFVDAHGKLTEAARKRWDPTDGQDKTAVRHVVVTIGPTTRDYLVDTFGFEPDVCARKPSPEGLGEGIDRFLRGKGLV